MNNKSETGYLSIYKSRENFIRSGTVNGSEFNYFDVPSNKYFKILFHFDDTAGLLTPYWTHDTKDQTNSAYEYLERNYELERKELLKDFIRLLSNISSESPWYFKEIVGLDNALNREIYDSGIKFEERRKNITIKCIQDSYDDRIGTLMDLYRAIVWSWQMKREVLPSNLRKFDMSVYIFNDVVFPFSRIERKLGENKFEEKYASFDDRNAGYTSSYKLIEFHNCEFDYNSAKTPMGSLDNAGGFAPEYSIDIFYDDCYETRYNEFLMKKIGDFLIWDADHFQSCVADEDALYNSGSGINPHSNYDQRKADLSDKINYYKHVEDKRDWSEKRLSKRNINTYKYDRENPKPNKNNNLDPSPKWLDWTRGALDAVGMGGVIDDAKYAYNKLKSITKSDFKDAGITALNQVGVIGLDHALQFAGIDDGLSGLDSKIKGRLLGNIFNYSVADWDIAGGISKVLKGDVMGAYNSVAKIAAKGNAPYDKHTAGETVRDPEGNYRFNGSVDGNIFDDNSYYTSHNAGEIVQDQENNYRFNDSIDGNIFDDNYQSKYMENAINTTPGKKYINKTMGNIFAANTIVNNI